MESEKILAHHISCSELDMKSCYQGSCPSACSRLTWDPQGPAVSCPRPDPVHEWSAGEAGSMLSLEDSAGDGGEEGAKHFKFFCKT